jgi:lipid II:glycine glycyltransferase (peptidoglycan interpeptide bridge formation enzyme)
VIGIENDACHQEWDEFVQASGGDIDQSTPWARFRLAMGFACRRVVARRGTAIVGGAQVFARRVGPWRLAYVPYGPLTAPDVSEGVAAELAGTIGGGVDAVFVQPPMHGGRVARALAAQGFAESDMKVAPSATLRLDISRPIEDIKRSASRHVREQIRRWERIGVEVREGTRDDIGLLFGLHLRSAEHGGFTPMSRAYLERVWDALAPGGHVWMLVGSVDGDPVAANLFSRFGGVVTGRVHGFDRASPHAKARVPAALVWAAIVRSQARGDRWLDFGGISRRAAVALTEGRWDSPDVRTKHEFKLAFGGRPFLYPPPVELVRDPAFRAGLRLARSVRPARRSMRRALYRMRMGTPWRRVGP